MRNGQLTCIFQMNVFLIFDMTERMKHPQINRILFSNSRMLEESHSRSSLLLAGMSHVHDRIK